MTSVSDGGTSAGFVGGSGTYTYDNNGNLTNEPYKGISIIGYNDLNRTDKITFSSSSNKYIDYTYDANGSLIRKRVHDNVGGVATLQNTTDYIDGFVYITAGTGTAALSYFPMPEGRVTYNGSSFIQEFIITDQQGNARVSFNNTGTGTTAKVIQENSYYAFGMIMPGSAVTGGSNKQLYNGGSEWQNDHAGNLPDYQQTFYRNYDAALGRFIGVDPVAESAESMTGYQYAGNNPVMFNDPMGDKPVPATEYWSPATWFGAGKPADVQASENAFYASADGGAYGADPGLTQYNVMTGDLGSYGVDQIDMTSIYHAGNKATGDPSTGSLAAAVALLNNISVANGGAPLSKYNTSWVYLAADGSILHQDVGEGSGGTHYYSATAGELSGQAVYTVNGEIANQEGGDPPSKHTRELAKYGYIVSGYSFTGTLSLGAGGTIEYGSVITNKNWAQDYYTVYYTSTAAATIGVTPFTVVNKQGKKTTFSDWAGPVMGGAVNYGYFSGTYGTSTTYNMWGGGLGFGLSFKAFGSGNVGWTYLLGSPYPVVDHWYNAHDPLLP